MHNDPDEKEMIGSILDGMFQLFTKIASNQRIHPLHKSTLHRQSKFILLKLNRNLSL